MRLIDADKLKIQEIYDEDLKAYGVVYEEDIKEREVKAIPIEELFRFIDSRAVRPDGTVKYTDDLMHLKIFISEWRMENEEGYRDEVDRWWAEHSSRFD